MSEHKSSKKPIVDVPSKKQLEEIALRPLSEEDLSGKNVDDRIEKLLEFFNQYGIDASSPKPEFSDYTKAYPNYDQYMYIPGRHDIKKWKLALKNVHYKQKAGFEYKDAIRQSTTGWPKMEIYDFLNWLRFQDEGSNMKYKFAQTWYENGQPGYFLHIKPDAPKEPERDPEADANAAREEAERKEEKKLTIEKQRAKIIGRLDSAEKLLRSTDGQMFAGNELESLMEAIYNLKKKVQLVNKLSISTRLYEDMIVREANVLQRNGFVKAASMLYSVAQTPGAAGEGAKGQATGDVSLPSSPPPDPTGAGQSGTMGPFTPPGTPSAQTPVDGDQNTDTPPLDKLAPPSAAPGTAVSSPAIIPQEDPQPEAITKFIKNMNDGNKTEAEDLEVVDHSKSDDELEVMDPEEQLMVSEAQAAPPPPPPGVPPAALEDVPMTDAPAPDRQPPAFVPTVDEKPVAPGADKPVDTDEPLEVTEDDIPASTSGGFSSKINNTFANVTLEDIVAELDDISKSYKTREQPRRLGWVDMALDSKGLASFFPSLSEAQNKALEANNYISTRVDDILAKLRGALASKESSPTLPAAESPELSGVKGKLKSDQDKEQQRKLMRKEQEAAALEETKKETPEVELGELGAPPAPAAPPAAVAPTVPKPVA